MSRSDNLSLAVRFNARLKEFRDGVASATIESAPIQLSLTRQGRLLLLVACVETHG